MTDKPKLRAHKSTVSMTDAVAQAAKCGEAHFYYWSVFGKLPTTPEHTQFFIDNPIPKKDEDADLFTLDDPQLNQLVNLAVDIAKGNANMDTAIMFMDYLERVQERLK